MVSDLPPPPSTPARPPAVVLAGEHARILRTADGVEIEAMARLPRAASRAVVLCHPHPLYGGSMHNAIVLVIARALRELGGDDVATLRFNFRGVPGSGGSYDEGRGELLDTMASIDAVRRELPQASVRLFGYSFGSWIALRATLDDNEVERVGLVAPATRIFSYPGLAPGRELPMHIVVGDHDQFVGVDDARALATRLGASITVMKGADHYFVSQRRAVADAIGPFMIGE
jgi:uncharacterized protein